MKVVGTKQEAIGELRSRAQVHRDNAKSMTGGAKEKQLGWAEGLEQAAQFLEDWEETGAAGFPVPPAQGGPPDVGRGGAHALRPGAAVPAFGQPGD